MAAVKCHISGCAPYLPIQSKYIDIRPGRAAVECHRSSSVPIFTHLKEAYRHKPYTAAIECHRSSCASYIPINRKYIEISQARCYRMSQI